LSSAVLLIFAWTERMVTYTWSKLPFGKAQLGGSVRLTLMAPVPLDILLLEEPPQLARTTANRTIAAGPLIDRQDFHLRSHARIGKASAKSMGLGELGLRSPCSA
jgi:hypothetical protein